MRIITLCHGEQAFVDEEDYEIVSHHSWSRANVGYPRMRFHGKAYLMHELLLKPPAGMDVDHINGNKLDNRRVNLRICTHGQNLCNSKVRSDSRSGYKGVSQVASRWKARVRVNGVVTHCGYFDTPEEAARARDAVARQLHGEFARLNFP